MKGLATFCWFSSMKDISKDIRSILAENIRITCEYIVYLVCTEYRKIHSNYLVTWSGTEYLKLRLNP